MDSEATSCHNKGNDCSLSAPEEIAEKLAIPCPEDWKRVAQIYPIKITPYYLSLIKDIDGPIGRQCLPAMEESTEMTCSIPGVGIITAASSPMPHTTLAS